MRKSRKSLKKLSACILAAAMTVTLAAPFSPLAEVKAAGEEAVNLAIRYTVYCRQGDRRECRPRCRKSAAVQMGHKPARW